MWTQLSALVYGAQAKPEPIMASTVPPVSDPALLLLSGAILAVSCLVFMAIQPQERAIRPQSFFQEEQSPPTKTISFLDDSLTVQTEESIQTLDDEKTVVTGSLRNLHKANNGVLTPLTIHNTTTPFPKKMRRAARKLLGIRKRDKSSTSLESMPEEGSSSSVMTEKERVAI